ncbi:MAG: ATP:cob(I)alamin adenosyltransferase [Chromatiales bacterium]|jgi:cob(I)alamin adenosyltransferase|nr:ATP:cob(I)alamin adenosyltransferase [Chromatiales bacterium]MDP7270433.1 cob(I)yrinic acid a,c-diamide adenosyltransferase [Gammaproteobacteria bacterium]HJP05300.1 cob(I)yrinic acid a,c-diamide adenosyltransferase [Gammaproteobacteria bacterium]
MGNRLSKIYTRTGDDGSTGLGDGTRVSKTSSRVEAYGCIDELNSTLGLAIAAGIPEELAAVLTDIQQQLFDLGGELCMPGGSTLSAADVDRVEQVMDQFNESLPPLKDFILPGGSPASAACHLARTVCRRAERRLLTLSQAEEINSESLRYLNRLSDLLFVVARVLNKLDNGEEVLWRGGKLKQSASGT